jgi:hypothetical protein
MVERLLSPVSLSHRALPVHNETGDHLADPATAEALGTVPEMGLAETKEAIDAAAKAFPAWSRTTAKVRPLLPSQLHPLKTSAQYRHDILMKLYALMKDHHDDLGRIIVRSACICHGATNQPLTCVQDARERKTTSGSEGVVNRSMSPFVISYPLDRAKTHIALRISR